jgi:hypothetical protein
MKKLNELLDEPVKYRAGLPGEYEFEIGNYIYSVAYTENDLLRSIADEILPNLIQKVIEENGYELAIDYSDTFEEYLEGLTENSSEVTFGIDDIHHTMSDKFGITGTGNQFTIFSTVIDIIKNELLAHDIDSYFVHFSAEEESRRKLYQMLSKKLSKDLRDWVYLGSYSTVINEVYVFVNEDMLIEELKNEGVIV